MVVVVALLIMVIFIVNPPSRPTSCLLFFSYGQLARVVVVTLE